jgi:hypothetical protein
MSLSARRSADSVAVDRQVLMSGLGKRRRVIKVSPSNVTTSSINPLHARARSYSAPIRPHVPASSGPLLAADDDDASMSGELEPTQYEPSPLMPQPQSSPEQPAIRPPLQPPLLSPHSQSQPQQQQLQQQQQLNQNHAQDQSLSGKQEMKDSPVVSEQKQRLQTRLEPDIDDDGCSLIPDDSSAEYQDRYYHLLLTEGVYTLRHTGMFIVQGYSPQTGWLTSKFHHVQVAGSAASCDCKRNRVGKCWHVSFVELHLLTQPEFRQEVKLATVVQLAVRSRSNLPRVFSVMESDDLRPAVVHQRKSGRLHCRVHRSKPCKHPSLARKFLYPDGDAPEVDVEADAAEEEEEKMNEDVLLPPTAASKQKIPVPLWLRLESDSEVDYQSPHPLSFPTVLTPDPEQCPKCKGTTELVPFRPYHHQTARSLLYTSTGATEVAVKQLLCRKCRIWLSYDGCRDRIFNFNNLNLFSHELMNSYTNSFGHLTTPFSSFVDSVRCKYTEMNGGDFVSASTFQQVYKAFIELQVLFLCCPSLISLRLRQAWDFQFSCPICGCEPPDFIADGVSITFPRDFCHEKLSPPTKVKDDSPVCPHAKTITGVSLLKPKTCALLRRLIGAVKRDKTSDFAPLTEEEEKVQALISVSCALTYAYVVS